MHLLRDPHGGSDEHAISRRTQPRRARRAVGAARKLSGKDEALLVATACSRPAPGRARRTLKLLAGEMIELTGHGDISCETVRRRLAENGLEPWRAVKIAGRRTNTDFAACMRDLVDIHYPDALLIRVVPDNLSTHSAGALYDAFPASEARRVLRHLEFHHPPNTQELRRAWPNKAS